MRWARKLLNEKSKQVNPNKKLAVQLFRKELQLRIIGSNRSQNFSRSASLNLADSFLAKFSQLHDRPIQLRFLKNKMLMAEK